MPRSRQPKNSNDGKSRAFTLVEMLAVMTIIIIMLGLLAPAISSMSNTAGRKGAVNILMNTFEQARAAALESGANVYVILWKRQFPEQDSILVMRDPQDWNKDEMPLVLAGEKISITPYLKLPRGILLYDGKGRNVFKSNTPQNFVDCLPSVAGVFPQLKDLGYVQFSPSGSVTHPSKDDARIFISEGVRGENGTEALIGPKKERSGLETITFRRFTGRASVDISTFD